MQNPSVHWSEGMFLRPHHFQASDRYWTELASLHSTYDHPYGYGTLQIAVSDVALSNGILEVVGIRARLRDGTIIACESNEVHSLDLKKRLSAASASSQPITVFLVAPKHDESGANIKSAKTSIARYVSEARSVSDEGTGDNRQEIRLKRLTYELKLSTEDLTGYETLPLLRLIPSSVNAGQFRVDPDYFPPMLTTQSWSELAGLMRDIRNFIGSRLKVMGSIVQDRGITLSSQVQGDMEKIFLMHVLNESYGELSCLAYASGVHPLVAYTSLCSIVGRCSIFGPTAMVEEVPQYDHDDLGRIFRWIVDQIKRLINSVKEDECIQRPFFGIGKNRLHVALEPEWFGPEWDWYFGINPINFEIEECYRLLKAGDLDWKLGSSDMVETIFTNRQPALKFKAVRELPRGLTNRGKWLFLQILLDNEPWKHVQLSQSLALRVKDEQISNSDALDGNRRLHVTVNGQAYGMEFAIFAVKKRA
jgi:type VI secretion system protein ImpJ